MQKIIKSRYRRKTQLERSYIQNNWTKDTMRSSHTPRITAYTKNLSNSIPVSSFGVTQF